MINSAIISLMGAYDPDATAYFNQLSPQPSTAFKAAVNTLVVQLKANGNWTTLDRLWIHATEVQQHATISLVNPTSAAITEVNSPTWTANQGYTGNGSNMYLNSNYTPSTHGVTFTQDSASMGVYTRLSQAASTTMIMGRFQTGTQSALALNWTSLGKLWCANSLGQDVYGGDTTTQGMYSIKRTGAASSVLYKNGSQIDTSTDASTSLQTGAFYMLAWSNAGTAANHSSNQLALSFVGGGLNHGTFYTAIQTFATTRGFNV